MGGACRGTARVWRRAIAIRCDALVGIDSVVAVFAPSRSFRSLIRFACPKSLSSPLTVPMRRHHGKSVYVARGPWSSSINESSRTPMFSVSTTDRRRGSGCQRLMKM